jgi:hypothetical protein
MRVTLQNLLMYSDKVTGSMAPDRAYSHPVIVATDSLLYTIESIAVFLVCPPGTSLS